MRSGYVTSAVRRTWWVRAIALVALLVIPAAAFAQFGHPFNGTYSGGWGKDQANRLLFNTQWTGSKVTGTVNSAGVTADAACAHVESTPTPAAGGAPEAGRTGNTPATAP